MDNSKKLRFKNGKLKIMQITDTQDTQKTATDTVRLIEAALDTEKPDLVVFTGDQIKGYGFNLAGGDGNEKARITIDKIIAPLEKRSIPFAVTFGNHDRFAGCGKEKQMEYYKSYSSCVNGSSDDSMPGGLATFNLPIYSENSDRVVFNLYIIDSLEKNPDGGYAAVSPEQIKWYEKTSQQLKAENDGNPVPSLVFQHIPVPEMYRLLKKVPKETKGAIQGNRANPDFYILDEKWQKPGSFMKENIASPFKSSGQFDSWVKQGDVIGAYFGHDHINCFNGTVDGIDLGYTPSCGFNVYGEGTKRAVRIFEFSEKNPADYKTRTLSFRNLIGRKVQTPVKDFLFKYAPTTVDAAIPMIIKAVIAIFGIAAAIALISFIF